jgi:hypothetical protein
MSTGTTHNFGLTAGAARPGPCPMYAMAGISAPTSIRTWHPQSATKQVDVVFATDRLIPRPLERSP